MEKTSTINHRLSWGILLLSAFAILIIFDIKKLKYLSNLLKELRELFKKNSKYTEDTGFVLIHKSKIKNL